MQETLTRSKTINAAALIESLKDANRTMQNIAGWILYLEQLIKKGVAPAFREPLFELLELIAGSLVQEKLARQVEKEQTAMHTMSLLNARKEFVVFFFALERLGEELERFAKYPLSIPMNHRQILTDYLLQIVREQ